MAGLTPVSLAAAVVPALLGAAALLLGRLGPDELGHRLVPAPQEPAWV